MKKRFSLCTFALALLLVSCATKMPPEAPRKQPTVRNEKSGDRLRMANKERWAVLYPACDFVFLG